MKPTKIFVPILLIAAIIVSLAGCTAAQPKGTVALAADLMGDVSPNAVAGKPADTAFIGSLANFSIDLFKKSITDGTNSLISPLSVMLALAMTANGADGETLAQMEELLGAGIPLAELNRYLHSYASSLPSEEKSRLNVANSIWIRDDGDRLQVKPDFLQRNADYYGAAAYKSRFGPQTVKDVNDWVKAKTDGMIDTILDDIDESDILFLINAVMFDAEWKDVYNEYQIRKGDFTDITGTLQNVDFMHSSERKYLEDDMAIGFIKPYAGGRYSFAALLPNENIPTGEDINSLTGARPVDIVANAHHELVDVSMPKFEYEYGIEMNNALSDLGIPNAFDMSKADFSRMGTSSDGPLYISLVLHKTFISVDELGTKAGAATIVAMVPGSSAPHDPKVVILDRPFVYAIIDNATNLPIFIGTLMKT
jgi:serpin B